ncbi:TPA: hypothetical protein ACYEOW_000738 [Raoultella terrigena]|uniref:Uncharacterized protein n=1 Tax=Raoultella terrigena TaxID=577 RepID=A0AAP9XLG8_RAOTE|nr:hypothetical protein [Raoultella terrigena]QPF07004.1 hypothetical protein IMO34_16785 [Raoultella terrigena]
MEHRYTRECEQPEYDKKISLWLQRQPEDPWGSMEYPVAIYHNGFIYRAIIGSGLGDYVSICEFLKKLGLVNLLADDGNFRGYDAVFAIPAVKIDIATGKMKLADIPRNPPPPAAPEYDDEFFWDDDSDDDDLQEPGDVADNQNKGGKS